MNLRGLRTLSIALLSLCVPSALFAQRELRWDELDVAAHLDASGNLRVVETQTMVFTGDWNGGERSFNIRPRQKLVLTGIYRSQGGARSQMTRDPRLDDVDDYAWIDRKTLRWRSRNRSDAPFFNTPIRYELRYVLSGVLLKDHDGYLLDHDFAFADRQGIIDRFVLRFTFDPTWRPADPVRDVYSAAALPPGQGFVLTLPLRYTGELVPVALDSSRPREIVVATAAMLGAPALALLWFFGREQSYGRFAPLAIEQVDEAWLRQHILKYPAEVIGAAWDESIGAPEIVALIARMVGEGKLESDVTSSSMTLRLKVDRSRLEGYERTLVDGLFFDGRTETSTDLVKAHYSDEGFNPAEAIRPELEGGVKLLLPPGDAPRRLRFGTPLLIVTGCAMLLLAWFLGDLQASVGLSLVLAALPTLGLSWILGAIYRGQIHWGRRAALACLIPALLFVAGAALFLWFYVGTGAVDLPSPALLGAVALVLGVMNSSINALRSRQHRAAIAFRRKLAAARAFFMAELGKEQPALRDEWYPWVLAFGLGRHVDDWSTQRSRQDSDAPFGSSEPVQSSPSPERWSGYGGGRSGGAGATGSWAAAAGGMAAGVPPARSSSSVEHGGSTSGGGSSSSASSGGGGGGGW